MSIRGVGDTSPVQWQPEAKVSSTGSAFANKFSDAMEALDKTTAQADDAAEGLVQGTVDIHEAMVAMEKADLVLKVAATMRNKAIEAYQQLLQTSSG